MIAKGSWVVFWSYDHDGNDVLVQGQVEEEFREPDGEDALQRLNYRVRATDGEVYTPYAQDCSSLIQVKQVVEFA